MTVCRCENPKNTFSGGLYFLYSLFLVVYEGKHAVLLCPQAFSVFTIAHLLHVPRSNAFTAARGPRPSAWPHARPSWRHRAAPRCVPRCSSRSTAPDPGCPEAWLWARRSF